MSLVLKECLVLDKGVLVKRNIVIDYGKIASVTDKSVDTGEVVDCSGLVALPGLIDVHVHARDSGVVGGLEHKEDFYTCSKTAVAGGVTTIIDMPNSKPPTTTIEALRKKQEAACKKMLCNFGFHFGSAQDNLGEAKNAKAAGAQGIKVYMGSSTGNMLLDDQAGLEKFFALSKEQGLPLVIHCEDESVLKQHAGKTPHSASRPPEAAVVALRRALQLVEKCGNQVHFAHVSTPEELDLIADAKKRGLRVSSGVTPHHLFLTTEDEKTLVHFGKMNPPLRHPELVEAMWKDLNAIDLIETDHAPHTLDEKGSQNPPSGVPGLETMLPLLLDAFNRGKIMLERIVELTAQTPSELFNLKGKGRLEKGFDADVVLVDLNKVKVVRGKEMSSKCGWSTFEGLELKGWPVKTFVNGNLVFDDGKFYDFKGKEVKKIG